jgi:hypothetical protein
MQGERGSHHHQEISRHAKLLQLILTVEICTNETTETTAEAIITFPQAKGTLQSEEMSLTKQNFLLYFDTTRKSVDMLSCCNSSSLLKSAQMKQLKLQLKQL